MKKFLIVLAVAFLVLGGCMQYSPAEITEPIAAVLSSVDAIQIISDILQKDYAEYNVDDDFWLEFHSGEVFEGKDYYRVQAYSLGKIMEDGSQASGTIGWFYVNKYTGKAFVDYGTSVLEAIN